MKNGFNELNLENSFHQCIRRESQINVFHSVHVDPGVVLNLQTRVEESTLAFRRRPPCGHGPPAFDALNLPAKTASAVWHGIGFDLPLQCL